MKPKKILYVEQNTDGTVGGSHFSLLYLIERLDRRRFAPTVIFYQDHHLVPQYRQAGCDVMILKKPQALNLREASPALRSLCASSITGRLAMTPVKLIQKPFNYFKTFIIPSLECWKILRRGGFELVHMNNTLLRPQQWILASVLTRTKIIAHERGINSRFPTQAFFFAKFLSAIICISEAVRSNLLRSGFPKEQLAMIYNGLDPESFKPKRDKADVRREIGVPSGPLVGIVGNIKAWKGQEIVIRSMRLVRERIPDARCLVIGGSSPDDAEYRRHVEQLIASEGLAGAVTITGFRKDVPDLVNCLDVLVHASVEPEPFGRVLLEGMALEKPVISNTIGSGPEIVADGVTGVLVPPAAPDDLAVAIITLLENPGLALEMGKAGRRRLDELFHISFNIEKTEELYSRVLCK